MDTHETRYKYAPSYCEENTWHLCQEPVFEGAEVKVVFVLSHFGVCRLWNQKISADPEEPVCWDYHAFVIARQEEWMAWDLDTRLGLPVFLPHYLASTFRNPDDLPELFEPVFRVIAAEEYLATFSSDRGHMLGPGGEWMATPPDWEPILLAGGSTMEWFLDPSGGPGDLLSLEAIQSGFAGGGIS